MALEVKVKCGGETHVIAVSAIFDEDGNYELVPEIMHPGHDYAYDVGAHEFGYALPHCYEAVEIIENQFDAVLDNEDLRAAFIEAISKHGIEALGIDREEFAWIVVELSKINSVAGSNTMSEIIANNIKWFGKTQTFREEAPSLAKLAYDDDNGSFFYVINKLYGGGLIRVVEEDDDEGSEIGSGSVINKATVKIFIGDYLVDKWSFGFVGWFHDIESMKWHVDRIDGSGNASSTTDDFLRVAGFAGRSDAIEDAYRPDMPELPKRYSSKGNWVIMHDEYKWGYFKTEEDARLVFDAMRDGSVTGRGDFGVYVRLMHIPKGADREDHDVWEEIDSEVL